MRSKSSGDNTRSREPRPSGPSRKGEALEPVRATAQEKPLSRKLRLRKARVETILPILKRAYPQAKCSLNHGSPLQLLVATILSAQCTDERVNIVTPLLFGKYKSAGDFAGVAQEELERDIQSTGFFRNKAKSIRAMAAALVAHHGGEVPQTMEELTALAGVGRKTANVVLGNAFGKNVGITVDTHVTRVSRRLGLTTHMDPVKIERDLIPLAPREDWTLWSHLLIHHGRATCTARKPACEACPLRPWCPAAEKLIAGGKTRGIAQSKLGETKTSE